MSEPAVQPRPAWQPLTPFGVAAFANASTSRLLLVQVAVAALCAAAAVWFVSDAWMPVAREAIARLPRGAEIRGGVLRWTTNTPIRLAENRYLALVVDAKAIGRVGRMADVELVARDTHVVAASLLGSIQAPLPKRWIISLDPADAIPWWGAREGPFRGLLFLAVMIGLFFVWWGLSAVYCPVAWALAFWADRRLGLAASWRLAAAALMPGALLLAAGILSYDLLGLDLISLGLVFLLHLLAGWVYLAISPWFLPRLPAAGSAGPNPFASPGTTDKPASRKSANPFAPPE